MSAAVTASPSRTARNLQQALKLALSVVLLFWLALALNWDMPSYGALAIVLISLDTSGASIQKGVFRVVGTTVGLAMGMLGLALFPQDSWLNLVYQASYLVVIGYFMQTSRYTYAWFVAGYLPSLVWATTYEKVEYVFHYAVFRYLETTSGVVIFTLVCLVFWRRSAGDELNRQGRGLWKGLGDLFRRYRRQLEDGLPAPDASALRAKLSGTLSRMLVTLQTAYADTAAVAAKKRAWEALRVNVRAVADAVELWHQSIADCRRLDLDRLLPEVCSSLGTLDERLSRIEELWEIQAAGEGGPDTADGDSSLLRPLGLAERNEDSAGLSHLDRAALLSFVQQLRVLDLASRELLHTLRILADLAPIRDLDSLSLPADLYRPAGWDSARMVRALVPAACFVAGYFIWLVFRPPTGPSIPNMAGTLALSFISSSMNVVVLIPILLIPVFLLVSPIYMFVMPKLNTGFQLLTLVFGYVFAVASLFGGRLAPLKTVTLVMFVMLTGISNEQRYSFVAVLDTGLMLLLGVGILAVVRMLMIPLRPEQILLKSARRFFLGCESVLSGFAPLGPADQSTASRFRRRQHESMIQPTIGQVQAAYASMDGDRYPDITPESVQQLIDGMQDIAYRLQAMDLATGVFAHERSEVPESLRSVVDDLREHLQAVFQCWATFETGDEFDRLHEELLRRCRELEQRFATVQTDRDRGEGEDRVFTDLYALMGSIRGLIDAMVTTQPAIRQIDWQQWEAARF